MWTLKKNYSREEDMKCPIWKGRHKRTRVSSSRNIKNKREYPYSVGKSSKDLQTK